MLKNKYLLTGAAIGVVVAGLNSTPVLAAGTAAGSTITNSVTVSYEVSGVDQTDASASDNLTVDRKVNLTVARSDNTATSVPPGAEDRAVTFQVTNTSNDTLDFDLSAAQVTTGGAAGITGTDGFDVTTPFTYYLDDGDGVLDGGDTVITHINALAADTSVVVHVVADAIPLSLANGLRAAIVLTATAHANDSASTLGAALVEATSNTAGVDTIFADAAGATDSARDAAHSAIDDFVVSAAALTATKSSTIIAGTGVFEAGAAIPGATIEYCITVTNAAGGAAATNLAISDNVPTEVTYDSGFGVKVGGANCSTPGVGAGSYGSGVVSGTIATLNAGSSQTLIFRATIN